MFPKGRNSCLVLDFLKKKCVRLQYQFFLVIQTNCKHFYSVLGPYINSCCGEPPPFFKFKLNVRIGRRRGRWPTSRVGGSGDADAHEVESIVSEVADSARRTGHGWGEAALVKRSEPERFRVHQGRNETNLRFHNERYQAQG